MLALKKKGGGGGESMLRKWELQQNNRSSLKNIQCLKQYKTARDLGGWEELKNPTEYGEEKVTT